MKRTLRNGARALVGRSAQRRGGIPKPFPQEPQLGGIHHFIQELLFLTPIGPEALAALALVGCRRVLLCAVLTATMAGLSADLKVERGRATLESNIALSYTSLSIPAALKPALHVDQRFVQDGIEQGGVLIDQAATAARWGAPVGTQVEAWLDEHSGHSIGFCPTNFGE